MKIREEKWSKIVLGIYLVFIFMMMSFWSYKTPFVNDDLFYSHNQIIKDSLADYFTLNGRFFGQAFTRMILIRGVLFSSICIGLAFVALLLILFYLTNSVEKRTVHLSRILLITVSLFLFVPGFASVFLWRAGVGNYLMTSVVELFFLLIVLKIKTDTKLMTLITLIIGFIAGLGNENTSGGILLICFLFVIKDYLTERKISLKLISGIIGLASGYIILLLSPGSKKRAQGSDYAYLHQNIFRRLFQGLEKQVAFFINIEYWTIVFLSLVLVVIVMAFIFWRSNKQFIDGLIFIIGGIASGIVMIAAPEGMDVARPYLGPTLLLLIGSMLLIPLNLSGKGIKAGYISTLLVLVLLGFFNVINGVRVAQNFNNQLFERYTYIANSNSETVRVKPIVQDKYNKYDLAPIFWDVKNTNNVKSTFPNNNYYAYFRKKVILTK